MKQEKKLRIVLFLMLCLLLSACRQGVTDAVNSDKNAKGKEGSSFGSDDRQVAQEQKGQKEQKGREDQEQQKEQDKQKQELQQVEKLFDDKDLVFTDPIIEAFEFKPYKTADDTLQDNIVVNVPNINLKSEDAAYFNKQMSAFSQYLIDRYKMEADAKYYRESNTEYRVFQKDDILSVVVFSYYPYSQALYNNLNDYYMLSLTAINIDLKTGKKLSDREFLEYFKIKDLEETLIAKILENHNMESMTIANESDAMNLSIKKHVIAGTLFKLWSDLYHLNLVKSDYVHDASLTGKDTTYWATYKTMYDPHPPVLFYSQEERAPVANMMYFIPAGAGYFFKSEYLSGSNYKKPELNPSYVYYAEKLGIDPNAKDAPMCLSGFIGYKNDEDAGFRLQSAVVYAAVELEKLSKQISLSYKDGSTVSGDEMYLIIPKHDEISLAFSTITMDEQMREEKYPPVYTLGNTFVLCNASDLYGDYELIATYRDQYIVYRPQVSLQDASNVVVDGVMDITEILREEIPLKSTPSDEFIEEYRRQG